jgi:hypothetical protein
MNRPQLEVADIIRSAGADFTVAPLPSVAISISAPAADIVPPSRTTVAAIGTARSVRPGRVNAASQRVAEVCQFFCVSGRDLFLGLGMGVRGKGQRLFPRPSDVEARYS